MSDKFYSLMTILNKLDRGEKTTVNSLMDELEVKERTIYRYIQTLQVAKFPVYYDRKKGSYRFTEGYSLGRPFNQKPYFLTKNVTDSLRAIASEDLIFQLKKPLL